MSGAMGLMLKKSSEKRQMEAMEKAFQVISKISFTHQIKGSLVSLIWNSDSKSIVQIFLVCRRKWRWSNISKRISPNLKDKRGFWCWNITPYKHYWQKQRRVRSRLWFVLLYFSCYQLDTVFEQTVVCVIIQ